MATKTAINLETLGAPDNDSEALNCYISEKGIQALPSHKNQVEGLRDNGLYLCKFFMCGIMYHVFYNRIIDENGNIVKAVFMEFDGNGVIFGEGSELELVPNFYFNKEKKIERDIKTVSYMTLTNPELSLYSTYNNRETKFSVRDNILALFSCNIIAFINDDNNQLTFIKNPTFLNSASDDVSEKSPLGVYIYRAFMPFNDGGNGLTAEFSGSCKITGLDVRYLALHEDTMIIYDIKSGKIKAIIQRRRRMPMDSAEPGYTPKNSNDIFLIWPVSSPSWGVRLFYVYKIYFFDHAEGFRDIVEGLLRTQFGRDWNGDNDIVEVLGISGWGNETNFRLYYSLPRPVVSYNIDATAHCFLYVNQGSQSISDPFTLSGMSYKLRYNHAYFMDVTKDNTISDIKNYIDYYIKNNGNIRTIDKTNDISYLDGETFVFQILDNPELRANIGEYHSQEYLWGQRSRVFTLGTKTFENRWPFISDPSLGFVNWSDAQEQPDMELKKFKSINWIGNDNQKATIDINEEWMIQFSDLSKIIGHYFINETLYLKAIYTLFTWPSIEETVEYKNAVYHSDTGKFGITNANLPYFVPSNVSDKIIGLYGEDRNIWTISSKSMEQFNISDIDVSPVQFTQLDRVYDFLIDWSGLNGKFDILTKEMGEFLFNGVSRVKKIFNTNSRILPMTAIKGIRLDVIDTGEMGIRLIDPKNREFLANKSSLIHAITINNRDDIFADGNGNIWESDLEGNNRFRIEWTYRAGRNVLLSKICIRTAQYKEEGAWQKRFLGLFRNNILIRERLTSEQAIDFYKIGRNLNSRLALETEGYLREIEITDTERGQK